MDFGDHIRTLGTDDILAFAKSHPPSKRANRFFAEFLSIASEIDPAWYSSATTITTSCRRFLTIRRNQVNKSTSKVVKEITVQSDYMALCGFLNKLIRARLLPSNTLVPPIPKLSDTFSEKECNVLGYVNLAEAVCAPSVEQALDYIKNEIHRHKKIILDECKKIVIEGYRLFRTTESIILGSDINQINASRDNLDARYTNPYGQAISFFSPSHPNGFKNSLAYLKDQHNSLFVRNSFPGSHHIYSWSTNVIRQHLGITDKFAVASMCIIIDELGINVSDLQDAKVQKTSDGEFITAREDGGITVSTFKPRANTIKERFAPKNSKLGVDGDYNIDIDAHTAISMLLEMRLVHAKALESNYLYILDPSSKDKGKSPAAYRLLDFRRKYTFRKIIKNLPDWVVKAEPTMPKIRVGQGLIKWIESGGDASMSSNYLGNSLITALRNYIPPELQEFMYRKKSRDLQNIHLLIADGLERSTDVYTIASAQLKVLVKLLTDNKKIKSGDHSDTTIYFLCSKVNLEIILSYVAHGKNKELVETCKLVIDKIQEEGSRKMIKLLSETLPQYMNFEICEKAINETK